MQIRLLPKYFSISNKSKSDTIYALASGYGKSAVAVIRISGENSRNVLCLLSKNREEYNLIQSHLENRREKPFYPMKKFCLQSHYVNYRTFYNPFSNFSIIDYGLLLYFQKPRSFTGEDVFEIQCHGGNAVKQEFLDVLYKLPNFRHAQPGEFTKVALINKKLDLMKVEALADLINSETQQQKELSINQFSGYYSKIYENLRDSLIKCLAHAEAFIDFEEEEDDVKTELYREVGDKVDHVIKSLESYLCQYNLNKTSRESLNIAIVGPPNAGKSSLMNLLCKSDVAIVSEIAGTTRDIISNTLTLLGTCITLNDTAGLRKTSDKIEKMGIEKTIEMMNLSFIICFLFDLHDLYMCNSIKFVDDSIIEINVDYLKSKEIYDQLNLMKNKQIIIVLNKTDKIEGFHNKSEIKVIIEQKQYICICLSVIRNQNISNLISKFSQTLKENTVKKMTSEIKNEENIITRDRHKELIESILCNLIRFRTSNHSVDICVEELREALKCFGKLLGKIDVEEILDVLFKEFCIGK